MRVLCWCVYALVVLSACVWRGVVAVALMYDWCDSVVLSCGIDVRAWRVMGCCVVACGMYVCKCIVRVRVV